MKAAIISLGSTSSKWTAEEMEKVFDSVDMINLKNIEVILGDKDVELLYNGQPFPTYDCVYVKGSFRYAPLLRSITTILTAKGVYCPLKPSVFTVVHDKLLTQLEMQRHKIPMPRTYITPTPEAAKEILERMNYPIIMKFPHGTQGKGVMVADSLASANSMMDALTALKQPFLLQEFIDTGGVDIRAIVIGDRVVAAYKRVAKEGEARANIHAGGHGENVELDAHTKKIAVEAAKSVGAEICGVDILEGGKGPVVLEINASPGLQGVTSTTKINVAEKIAKYLFAETSIRVKGKKNITSKEILSDLGIQKATQDIITSLDFRSKRILLPELVTKLTNFSEEKEYVINANQGKLEIKEFKLNE